MTVNKTAPLELWYKRIAIVSVGAVLFLILVGGIVRSTGSGMGCPDWPKCFGLLVPPTTIEEIPQSFFETHPQFETKSFNAFQTWVEYLNRLTGATIGLLTFATALLSLAFWKSDKRILVLSVGAMLLTGFEGWLGKLVVDHNLAGGFVTLHLLVAMVIVAMLISANYLVGTRQSNAAQENIISRKRIAWLGFGVMLLSAVQILLGTQVRESVDEVAASLAFGQRGLWLQSSLVYSIHKIAWIIVAAAMVVWTKLLLEQVKNKTVRLFAISLVVMMGLEILFGALLAYMDLPPVVQPLHMLFANLIFAAEFSILVYIWRIERFLAKDLNKNTSPEGVMINAE